MLFFFPQGVLDEILNLIESVSEGFPSYFFYDFVVFNGQQFGSWPGVLTTSSHFAVMQRLPFSCTPDKDIRVFHLYLQIIPHPCYLTQDRIKTRVFNALVV